MNFESKKKILNKYKPKILVQNSYTKSVLNQSAILKDLKKDILYLGTSSERSKFISKELAREYLKINKKSKLLDYGFIYEKDKFPQDNITWFLIKK